MQFNNSKNKFKKQTLEMDKTTQQKLLLCNKFFVRSRRFQYTHTHTTIFFFVFNKDKDNNKL